MDERSAYQVVVPATALSDLIDAVHGLASAAPAPKWRHDNVTYLEHPRVRDLPLTGDPRPRAGRAVAAITLLLARRAAVDVVFALDSGYATAEFHAPTMPPATTPTTWPHRLATATASALTARGITTRADPIGKR